MFWAEENAPKSVPKALPHPAKLNQKSLEHIVERHWATSSAKRAGKFSRDTSARSLKNMIEEAASKGKYRPNTRNRLGTIIEHDFGRQIGVNTKGETATKLRVVVDPQGEVVTAFPY